MGSQCGFPSLLWGSRSTSSGDDYVGGAISQSGVHGKQPSAPMSGLMSPRLLASAAACARLRTSSLSRTWLMCVLTVSGPMPSSRAICLFERPSVTRCMILCSRTVSSSSTAARRDSATRWTSAGLLLPASLTAAERARRASSRTWHSASISLPGTTTTANERTTSRAVHTSTFASSGVISLCSSELPRRRADARIRAMASTE